MLLCRRHCGVPPGWLATVAGTSDDRPLVVYAQCRGLLFHASFVAEKSYGPTNPDNAVFENDPGVVGALFTKPNTSIHFAGRSFTDRACVGKMQVSYRLPSAWGGFEVVSIIDYLDGLVFARQLLVTGLPQGPFLVGDVLIAINAGHKI